MLSRILLLLLFPPAALFGQNAQRTGAGTDAPCDATVLVESTGSPSDLIDLIRHSNVILDGTVQSLLPTVEVPGSPLPETDAVVNVTTVFRGNISNNSADVVIAENGGELGRCRQIVDHDALVAPGERYIFFLLPCRRNTFPNSTHLPRYIVVGIWAGKFKVTAGVVNVSPYTSPALAALSGEELTSFVELLRSRIRQPYTDADKNLPIFPGPRK
jgi:hypothetical protein